MRLIPVLLVALLGSACVRADAKTPGASPALAVPAPPPRTLVPSPAEPEPGPPVAAPAVGAPAAPRPAEPPPPVRTPPPPTTPPATPPPTPVPETLPQEAAAKMSALEKTVRDDLATVTKMLGDIKTEALSREARDHYNTAVSHVRAAREALDITKNLTYANELVQRAMTIAKQLTK